MCTLKKGRFNLNGPARVKSPGDDGIWFTPIGKKNCLESGAIPILNVKWLVFILMKPDHNLKI